jgi:hypothetical protein
LVDYHHDFTKAQDMIDHTSMIFAHLRDIDDLSVDVIPDVSLHILSTCVTLIVFQILNFFSAARILFLPWLELRLTSDDNTLHHRVILKKQVDMIWNRTAADDIDPFDPFMLGTREQRKIAFDALLKWIGDSFNIGDVIPRNESVIGAVLVGRTLWKWKYEHTHKKRLRVHEPMARVAIMEDIRQRYLWTKLNDDIIVQFRFKLASTIEKSLQPINKKVDGKWKTSPGVWIWPVVFPDPNVSVPKSDLNWAIEDEDTLVWNLSDRQVARIRVIQVKQDIQRVIDTVQRCSVARFSPFREHAGMTWHDIHGSLTVLCEVMSY